MKIKSLLLALTLIPIISNYNSHINHINCDKEIALKSWCGIKKVDRLNTRINI